MSARSLLVKALPCLACEKRKIRQPMVTEEQHLLIGGNAGQKRRGDAYSIPLCTWHHRAEPLRGCTKSEMTSIYGPSLAWQSKAFRLEFGTDDELLAETNRRIQLEAE